MIDVGGAVVAPPSATDTCTRSGPACALGAPVRDATSVAEVVAAVADYAAANPDESWIEGLRPRAGARGLFDARWLDDACADRPVVLTSSDQHCIWANTRALEIAGIDADCQPPPGGEIPHRSDGSVLGTLREWEAMELLKRHVPRPDGSAARGSRGPPRNWPPTGSPRSRRGGERARRAHLPRRRRVRTPEGAGGFGPTSRPGNASTRLTLRRWPATSDSRRLQDNAGDPWVAAGTVKFFSDGVVEAGTAALLEPRRGQPAHVRTTGLGRRGTASASRTRKPAGFDVHIHAIGDAGIRNALDAIEASPGAGIHGVGQRSPRPGAASQRSRTPCAGGVTANFEPYGPVGMRARGS